VDAFLSGVVAGYGIAIPVGAIALLIIQVGVKCGFRCAFMAGVGAATADLAYAGLAVIGGAALAQIVDSAGTTFRILSGIVLVAIALLGLRKATKPVEEVKIVMPKRSELVGTYFRFLGLTIINPTTIVYFAAVVVGLGVASDLTATGGAVFAVGAFLASLSWQTLLAVVGSSAGIRMSPRVQKVAMVGGNLLILGLGVLIVVR
jgi:threonine/homoserine/homoserine lactone efflux protein